MPLGPDDTVCFCFHVTKRKIETYCRVEKPQAASQISQCLSAGTGCGWCIPMIRKIHTDICGEHKPWWRETGQEPMPDVDPEQWKAGRRKYIAEGKGTPAPGAED